MLGALAAGRPLLTEKFVEMSDAAGTFDSGGADAFDSGAADAFDSVGQKLWNDLPHDLRTTSEYLVFK